MSEVITLEKPLWEAAKEAFETMIMLPIEPTDESECISDDVESTIGSITFSGEMQGAVILKCSVESAEKIAKSMLMMESDDEVDKSEIHDAFGEVVNLVIGGFKSRIADSIGNIDISVPMVIEGKQLAPGTGSCDQVSFVCAKTDESAIKFFVVYKDSN